MTDQTNPTVVTTAARAPSKGGALGLTGPDFTLMLILLGMLVFAPFILNPFPATSAMAQFNAGYPDLMQRFVIFGIFAVGFNLLFGLTGYLSFGHAAFLGVGSYAAIWSMKLITLNVLPAIILAIIVAGAFSWVVGKISLRRSGIYFSILTLAFAQMSYALAYSVLTPLTGGETGLQIKNTDNPLFGANNPNEIGRANFFGLEMGNSYELTIGSWLFTFNLGYYIAAVAMLVAFYLSIRIFRSPFGVMLRAVKSNQNRMNYTGLEPKRYTGTLMGPVLGAGFIKYLENIVSKINKDILHQWFAFLPDGFEDVLVTLVYPFVGKGWHLTMGILFMLVVIFLPGGLLEGGKRVAGLFRRNKSAE